MRNRKYKKTFFAVVEVASGIPVSIEIFENMKKAQEREKKIRRKMHPENDETGVFEVEFPFLI